VSLRTATAVIDRKALISNFNYVKSLAPKANVLAVLKANAYGHGLEQIAKALPQADAFGVARIDEALALRKAGVEQAIVLLEGFFEASDLPLLVEHNLQTIVHNPQQLSTISQAKLKQPIKVWLKIDTGMHRLGVDPAEFSDYYQVLSNCNNVQQPMVLMSHFASADEQKNPSNQAQIRMFEQVTKGYDEARSLSNSAGIYAWPAAHYEWVRPGLLLYGVSPMDSPGKSDDMAIKPVMTLQSSLIAVRTLAKGEGVGYGGTWISSEATKIGVVAIGYGDGYPRHAKNGTPVLLNGRRVPLIGRVSMDMICIDLGLHATDNIGDIAILWGQDLAIEEIAECATTIAYELLCNISRRVQIKLV
jgi:alanine racemase